MKPGTWKRSIRSMEIITPRLEAWGQGARPHSSAISGVMA